MNRRGPGAWPSQTQRSNRSRKAGHAPGLTIARGGVSLASYRLATAKPLLWQREIQLGAG